MQKQVILLGVAALVLTIIAFWFRHEQETKTKIVVGTEPVRPAAIGADVIAMRAETKKDMDLLWRVYQLAGSKPAVNFKKKEVYFLALYESGSCPYEAETMNMEVRGRTLQVEFPGKKKPCTDDALPRTFYIVRPKASIDIVFVQNRSISLYEFLEEKQAAWAFLQKQGWAPRADGDWRHAVAYETANNQAANWIIPMEGKKLVAVSFLNKGNTSISVPEIFVDPQTNKVAGYIPGE